MFSGYTATLFSNHSPQMSTSNLCTISNSHELKATAKVERQHPYMDKLIQTFLDIPTYLRFKMTLTLLVDSTSDKNLWLTCETAHQLEIDRAISKMSQTTRTSTSTGDNCLNTSTKSNQHSPSKLRVSSLVMLLSNYIDASNTQTRIIKKVT